MNPSSEHDLAILGYVLVRVESPWIYLRRP